MISGFALVLAFGIGVVAGLRSLTAPTVVAWAAHLGWMNLSGTSLAFMGSIWAAVIFTVAALGEFVWDLLPVATPRTDAPGLVARILMGLLTGACLGIAGNVSPWLAGLLGATGAVAGAFGGYHARAGLVRALRAPDFAVATPEDLVAIGLGVLLVTRF